MRIVLGGEQREQQRSRPGEPVAAQAERLELADRATRAFPLAIELSELHQLPGEQRRGRGLRRRQLRCSVGRRRAQARFPVQETRGHRGRASKVQRRRLARDRTHGKHRGRVIINSVTNVLGGRSRGVWRVPVSRSHRYCKCRGSVRFHRSQMGDHRHPGFTLSKYYTHVLVYYVYNPNWKR